MIEEQEKNVKYKILYIFYSPDLHIVKTARKSNTLQDKVGEIEHNLQIDLHNDLENTVSIVGVVVGVVG